MQNRIIIPHGIIPIKSNQYVINETFGQQRLDKHCLSQGFVGADLHEKHIPRHCSGFPGSTGKLKSVVHGREFEIAETAETN